MFTVLLASSSPVMGEETIDCSNASNTYAINACIEKDLKKADAQLNANYKALLRAFKGDRDSNKEKMDALIKSLKQSQRQWITYRDLNCEFHSNQAYGGSASGTYRLSCTTQMTEERADELKKALEVFNETR